MRDRQSTNHFEGTVSAQWGCRAKQTHVPLQLTLLSYAKNLAENRSEQDRNPLPVPSCCGDGDAFFRPVAMFGRRQENGLPSSRCDATRKNTVLHPRNISAIRKRSRPTPLFRQQELVVFKSDENLVETFAFLMKIHHVGTFTVLDSQAPIPPVTRFIPTFHATGCTVTVVPWHPGLITGLQRKQDTCRMISAN